MAVKWTRTALANLGQMAEHIAQDNPGRAGSFVQEIREQAILLASFPTLGRPGRVMGTRELVAHKNYIIAYRVRGKDVEVIRVQHVAKRWPASFD